MSQEMRPYIFIDTCSLLDSCWNCVDRSRDIFEQSNDKENMFWESVFPSLTSMGDVILPKRNYEELIKHSKNRSKPDLALRAQHILDRVSKLVSDRQMQIVGDANDPFADAILLSVALKFRTQRNMAFITQDRKLADDLEAIRNFRSVVARNGVDIKIRRIARTGKLEAHRGLSKSRPGFANQNSGGAIIAEGTNTSKGWWE